MTQLRRPLSRQPSGEREGAGKPTNLRRPLPRGRGTVTVEHAITLLAAAGLFAIFWCFSPPDDPTFRLCPFHWLTGRPCPLCGITRAFCALAKGHLAQAVHFNALSPLAFVMVFSLFWKFRWRAELWNCGLAAIAIYGVCRAVLA